MAKRAKGRGGGRHTGNAGIFGDFQNAMRGSRNRVRVLSQARATVDVGLFPQMIAWLRANTFLSRDVFHPEYPTALDQLKSTPVMAPIAPIRELRWAVAYLAPHASRLRRFVDLSLEFDRAYLSDNGELCERVLDEIQSQFGQSLWLIEHRLPALQMKGGLESQKRFADEVRASLAPIPSFIVFFASVRSEMTIAPARVKATMDRNLNSPGFPSDLAAYIRHHFAPDQGISLDVLAHVLLWECSGAVLDYYESVVSALRCASAMGGGASPMLASVASSLYRQICDPRLGAIAAGLADSPDDLPNGNAATIQATDALLAGDTELALSCARTALTADPSDPDAMVIASRATSVSGNALRSGDGALCCRLICRMASVISKGAGAAADALELERHAFNFPGSSWACAVMGEVEQAVTGAADTKSGGRSHLAALSVGSVHPLRTAMFPPGEARVRYARLVRERLGKTLGTAYALALGGAPQLEPWQSKMMWEEVALLEGEAALAAGDYEQCLEAADRLAESIHPRFRRRAAYLGCRALLRLGNLRECAGRLTSVYVQERNWHDVLPIADVTSEVVIEGNRQLSSDLSLPILFEVHKRHVGAAYDSECTFSVLDFLEAHGLGRPSAAAALRERFDREKLIYFLRHVCVESVMDRSCLFETSGELLEERLAICRALVELDESNLEVYHSEIKTLLRRLMLKRRLPEIEQSKIFVDTDSMKRTVELELRESFNRYKALRRERADLGDPEEVHSALRKANEGDLSELAGLTLPKNETTEIFESLVLRLRDEYVSSPEHGLDKYLSVRIRHGTLTAHLRKPVDAAKLVTARAVGSSEYKPNDYWTSRLWAADSWVRQAIGSRLADFSRDFDLLVDDVKSWIQVTKDMEGPGLFSFPLAEPVVRLFVESVKPETTFEQFVDYMIDQFGQRLEDNLDRVRGRLADEAKVRASDMLERLAADVEHYAGATDVGELVNAIRTAKTELLVTLDRVSAWFRPAREAANDPFSIEEAIYISAETVRTVSSDFQFELKPLPCAEVRVEGRWLTIFVDVFFITFENIIRHSRIDGPPVANVSVETLGSSLQITVENEVGPDVAVDEAKTNLGRIKREMESGRHGPSVSREGGTGLHKLGELLAHDLGSKADLDFGFAGPSRFYVRFSVPVTFHEGLVAGEAEP